MLSTCGAKQHSKCEMGPYGETPRALEKETPETRDSGGENTAVKGVYLYPSRGRTTGLDKETPEKHGSPEEKTPPRKGAYIHILARGKGPPKVKRPSLTGSCGRST